MSTLDALDVESSNLKFGNEALLKRNMNDRLHNKLSDHIQSSLADDFINKMKIPKEQ